MSDLADTFSDISIDEYIENPYFEEESDPIEHPYFEEESIDEYPDSL